MFGRKSLFILFTFLLTFLIILTSCQQQETEAPSVEPTRVEPTEVMEEEQVEPTEAPTQEIAMPTEPSMEEEGPLYGGTFVIAHSPDVPTCNVAVDTQVNFVANVFDGLVRYNGAMELQPQLAESWDVSDDNLTVTFRLRDDVKWHDGMPFTSADVKFTFDEMLMVYHPRGKEVFECVESIETPDDYTVVFNLAYPRAAFMYQVAAHESQMMPKHIYENEDILAGPHATCEELPIGTGPFIAVDRQPGVSFTMERNPDWWGSDDYWGGPYLDRVVVMSVADESVAVNGIETGEFDYSGWGIFPPHEIDRFLEMEGRDMSNLCMGTPALRAYGINLRREPLNDLRVRQAIAWALDRDEINKRVWYGHSIPSSSFLPPTHSEFNPELLNAFQPRDLAKAEALLDEAGYPRGEDGVRFTIRVVHDTRADRADMAAVFKQLVEEIGIKVELDAGDPAYMVDKAYIQHDFDVAVISLGVREPSVGVARIFLSDNIGPASFNNIAAYVNPEMDELWETYSTIFDPEIRKATMYRIHELALEDLPYIFVNTPTNFAMYDSGEFAGFPEDCSVGYGMIRTFWWKEGRPNP